MTGVQGFLARQEQQVKTLTWHVLQISETSVPGELRVHFMTEGGAMAVQKVKVPRRLYVELPPDADPSAGSTHLLLISHSPRLTVTPLLIISCSTSPLPLLPPFS